MYKYKITLERYGGEFAVGTITSATFKFWFNKGMDTLQRHIVSDDVPGVPEEHCLYPWFENDDLIHTNGVDFNGVNVIRVEDESTGQSILEDRLDSEWIKDNAWVMNDYLNDRKDGDEILVCTSQEKGFWEYELIESREPFDASKLEFFLYDINGACILDHLEYDGGEVVLDSLDTVGKVFEIEFS